MIGKQIRTNIWLSMHRYGVYMHEWSVCVCVCVCVCAFTHIHNRKLMKEVKLEYKNCFAIQQCIRYSIYTHVHARSMCNFTIHNHKRKTRDDTSGCACIVKASAQHHSAIVKYGSLRMCICTSIHMYAHEMKFHLHGAIRYGWCMHM